MRMTFGCDTASWSSAAEWVGPRFVAQEVALAGCKPCDPIAVDGPPKLVAEFSASA